MNIAVYATDHGWGHVSRQLAWIEKIPWNCDDRIYFVNTSGKKLIDECVIPNLIHVDRETDPGLLTDDENLEIDRKGTELLLKDFYSRPDELESKEKDFLKEKDIDLVISDIPPYVFPAAHQLNIPSLALSSFEWHWVYRDLFRNTKDESIGHILDHIYTDYYQVEKSFILPLADYENHCLPNSEKINLIARVDRDPEIKEENSVTIMMGYSSFPEIGKKLPESYKSYVPEHLADSIDEHRNYEVMNKRTVQEYISRSRFVITKTGYSSIAECIALKKPVIGIKRRNCIEDETISDWIERSGIGITLYYDEWNEKISDGFDNEGYEKNYATIPDVLKNTGWKSVKRFIDEIRR